MISGLKCGNADKTITNQTLPRRLSGAGFLGAKDRKELNMTIDIGDYCVQCFHSVAPESGRYVNRIPADRCDGVNHLHLDGWLCEDCLSLAEVTMGGIRRDHD
jgi:hypothetical protein